MIQRPPRQNKMLKKSELEPGKNYKCILSKKTVLCVSADKFVFYSELYNSIQEIMVYDYQLY